jgi:hypothetical protein
MSRGEKDVGPRSRGVARSLPSPEANSAAPTEEAGTASLEAVLVVPVLMLLVLVAVQLVLWAHAAQVVQLAASEGDRSARVVGGTPTQGVAVARSVLDGSGSDVSDSSISVTVLPSDLTKVEVTGHAEAILPGFTLPVSATVVGPIQEFRTSG